MSRTRSGSVSTVPFDQETQELLDTARSDIQRLREKEERKVGRGDTVYKVKSCQLFQGKSYTLRNKTLVNGYHLF